ncbi:MAG: tRNA pseudouridine(65) synthase TruC [Rhodothermales bacterium]|nr:tRNA pseudouridine(65) synthase TruC [Rhodothermales bacterium]
MSKPAGMQVHRQHRGDSGPFLLQWVRDHVGFRVYPVHRLDKPTSGLMVFAATSAAAATLSEAFRERQVQKSYRAIVRGHLDGDGSIDYALGPVRDRFSTSSDEKRSAVTDYRVLQRSEVPVPVGRYQTARYSLVDLRPRTGRRHQLRRHMKHVFHPIIGDRKYGDRDHNRFVTELGFSRLALCSVELSIDSLGISRSIPMDAELSLLANELQLRSND